MKKYFKYNLNKLYLNKNNWKYKNYINNSLY